MKPGGRLRRRNARGKGAVLPRASIEALDRAGDLAIRARTYAEGAYQGRHRTPDRGSSTEFFDYRAYTPGDPLQLVDWRLYGRTDKHFIRRFHQESQLSLTLVVDGSASMRFASLDVNSGRGAEDPAATSKYLRACELAATLAYLAIRQGDRVGLVLSGVMRGGAVGAPVRPLAIPAGAGWRTFHGIIDALETSRPQPERAGPGRALAEGLAGVDEAMPTRGMVVAIGDGLEQATPLLEAMARTRYSIGARRVRGGRDVSILHVLTDDELDIARLRGARLIDAETGVEIRTHGESIATAYRERVEAHCAALRRGLTALGGRYVLCRTSGDPVEQLRAFLA